MNTNKLSFKPEDLPSENKLLEAICKILYEYSHADCQTNKAYAFLTAFTANLVVTEISSALSESNGARDYQEIVLTQAANKYGVTDITKTALWEALNEPE